MKGWGNHVYRPSRIVKRTPGNMDVMTSKDYAHVPPPEPV